MSAQAPFDREIPIAEFASMVLANRRNLLGLTVAQISELAAGVIVLDNQLNEAESRIISMMSHDSVPDRQTRDLQPLQPKPEPEIKYVVSPVKNEILNRLLSELVVAGTAYESSQFADDETQKRMAFEKAALALAKYCKT